MGTIIKRSNVNNAGEYKIKHSFSNDSMEHNTTTSIEEKPHSSEINAETQQDAQQSGQQYQSVSVYQPNQPYTSMHTQGIVQPNFYGQPDNRQMHINGVPHNNNGAPAMGHTQRTTEKKSVPDNRIPNNAVPTGPAIIKKTTIDTEANTKILNDFLAKGIMLSPIFKKTGLRCPNAQQIWIDPQEASFFYIVGVDNNNTIDIYPAENAFSRLGLTYVAPIFDIVEKMSQNKTVRPVRALLTNFGYYQVQTRGEIEIVGKRK